jgi:hypothetical protein
MRTLNIEDRFSGMAGAKGGFDRKELRDLRRRKRDGQLTQSMKERLDYLQKVNRGKLAKGAAIAGLAAAAIVGPAVAAGTIGKAAGGKGASGLAAALKSGKVGKGVKVAKKVGDLLAQGSDVYGDPNQPIQIKNGGRLPYKVIKKRK